MNKTIAFIITFLSLIGWAHLHPADLSLSLSESIRNPLNDSLAIDYQITTALNYNDNIDFYYLQERTNGITEREYWLQVQRQVYRLLWLSGKRMKGKDSDLWLADLKFVYEDNSWKTALGCSNCWEYGKYKPKLLVEETKTFNIDFFLTPFELSVFTKLLADTEKLYHEERIELKFLVNIPTSLKLNKYLNAYIKLYILSKDYGFYRWQEKLMLEVNFK